MVARSVLTFGVMLALGVLLLAGSALAYGAGQHQGDMLVFSASTGNQLLPNPVYDLMLLDVGHQILVNLTKDSANDIQPVWSPDGTHIAYMSSLRDHSNPYSHAITHLYVMDADGQDRRRLTQHDTDAFLPAWSPDGRYIAYLVYQGEWYHVYVADPQRGMVRQVDSATAAYGALRWSNDSHTLVFASPHEGRIGIAMADVDGGAVRYVLPADNGIEPDLSPDGRHVAFVGISVADIFVMRLDGTTAQPVAAHAAVDDGPVWSPDGTRIAFISERHGLPQLHVAHVDDSTARVLTDPLGADANPQWTPDGESIAFLSNREEERYNLYIVNVASGALRRVTSWSGIYPGPGYAWRP